MKTIPKLALEYNTLGEISLKTQRKRDTPTTTRMFCVTGNFV
jgi:hypothetical protein